MTTCRASYKQRHCRLDVQSNNYSIKIFFQDVRVGNASRLSSKMPQMINTLSPVLHEIDRLIITDPQLQMSEKFCAEMQGPARIFGVLYTCWQANVIAYGNRCIKCLSQAASDERSYAIQR